MASDRDRRRAANAIRTHIERAARNETLADFFTGAIYGEDGDGNWLVGYGVCGSGNVVVTPERVEYCGVPSVKFSAEAKRALADLRNLMENC